MSKVYKMKKVQSIFIISIMLMSTFPLITAVSAQPEMRLLDGWKGISTYAGKPPGSGGGGGTVAQEKDWGYMRIGADGARSRSSGNNVVVAVLDTGVDYSHEDLQGVVIACFSAIKRADFACTDKAVLDDEGHGTRVTGTSAALDNTVDSVGIASGHVKIINGKSLGRRGGSWDDLAWGIRHATDLGANVISMSLGGDLTGFQSTIDLLQAAIDYAYNAGVAIVAAAGNEGATTCSATDVEHSWPAENNHVIAVGATGLYLADGSGWATTWTGAESDVMPCFSNSGPYLDIAAPGVYITASKKGGGVTDLSGTSMATPHVSALMALLMLSGYTNAGAEARMYNTAYFMPNYPSTLQGHGLIQADLAV